MGALTQSPISFSNFSNSSAFMVKLFSGAGFLARSYERLFLRQVRPLIEAEGLTASVYTQISDVEQEMNGLMTYDREVLKIDADTLCRINARIRFSDAGGREARA